MNNNDPVNKPKHYLQHPSGVECIDITRHMNFNLGNAVKYLWRQGLKDGQPDIQDLKKAVWYIQDEITTRERLVDNVRRQTEDSTEAPNGSYREVERI